LVVILNTQIRKVVWPHSYDELEVSVTAT